MLGQMMEPLRFSAEHRTAKTEQRKKWALTGCKNRKPNIIRSLYLKEGALEKLNKILQRRYQSIQNQQQRWEELFLDDARIILVAYGTMARIARSVVIQLRKKGKRIGLIRPISLWPFPKKAFTRNSSARARYLVIEMSYGQMLEDVKLTVGGRASVDFFGRAGGGIPSEKEIINVTRHMEHILRLYMIHVT
jgi:2-oxoglutarate ferredoxin oxidoreductase subunit alpha